MFDYMSNSQIAALILGIVFSIIAIATTCLAFKYASKFNSFAKAISMALVAPFIAFVSWLFLIFSYLDGFREDEVLNLIISILLAVIICGMIIIVARALYNKHEDEFVLADQAEAEAKAKAAEVEATETNVENENTEEAIKQPLLIESSLTNENTVEEQPIESDNAEEQTESEAEEADENKIEENTEESVESEENQEETVEENNDEEVEVAEDNNVEENADVETDETEEPAVEENTDETVEENNEDDSTAEDDDEDLEFEKFLEALREKAKAESENKDSNDTDEE